MKFTVVGDSDHEKEIELLWRVCKTLNGIILQARRKEDSTWWCIFGVNEKGGNGFLYGYVDVCLGLALDRSEGNNTIQLIKQEGI